MSAEPHRRLTAAGHGDADNSALPHYYAPLEVRP